MTAVLDASGRPTYPWLARNGLEALAAMRNAAAAFPARERPRSNRIVLYVRPPFTIPRAEWVELAQAFAPLALGADLEKVVLRVRIPEPDGTERDAVLEALSVRGEVTAAPQVSRNADAIALSRQAFLELITGVLQLVSELGLLGLGRGEAGSLARLNGLGRRGLSAHDPALLRATSARTAVSPSRWPRP